jgi:hypothetical protein
MAASIGAASVATACGRSLSDTEKTYLLEPAKDISGMGYGVDPDMTEPKITWDLTLSAEQLALAAALADIILPKTDELPAASEVGVPEFINEWVSSPYPMTQKGRRACLDLFEWLEGESLARFETSFASIQDTQKTQLLDLIAWKDKVETGLEDKAANFGIFRSLAVSSYFASEEGSYWLGYRGNQPLTGDYPGPTDEALDHLKAQLTPLGLKMPSTL